MMEVSVRLLGCFELEMPRGHARIGLPPCPARILSFFLLNPKSWHSRDAVIELFWPDVSIENAKSSLNSALHRMNKALKKKHPPFIKSSGREALMLSDEVKFVVDADHFAAEAEHVDEALDECAALRLQNALNIYCGDLLPLWYDDWILVERERLRHLFAVSNTRLMLFHEQSGALEPALACGRRLLVMEPLNEAVHRALMRIYVALGNRAAALRQYAECCRVLDRELGVSPMTETSKLHQTILRDDEAVTDVSSDITSSSRSTLDAKKLSECMARCKEAQKALNEILT